MLNSDPLRSKKRESSEDSKGFGTADEGNTEASTSSESNFSQLFKNTGKTFESVNQQRKTTFQKEQREKYNELVDKNRELSEVFEVKEMGNLLIKDEEDEEENTSGDDVGNEMEDELGNEMEEEVGSELANQMESEAEYDMANKIIQGKTEEPQKDESMETEASTATKKKKVICFRLTESQWLTEVPEDLSDKWLVKFCPKGSRRLILCNHRTTKVFDKYGIFQMEFHSKLPGGGGIPEFSSSTPGLTALDCVYHFPKKTFFVLDVMVWNCASFLHCEAELRLCWIRSKYIDNPECFEGYEQNSFRFEVVFDYPADPDTIAYQLSQYDTNCAVGCEGVLFYHKEAPYISGNTDCVTWLKPFMLQELMDIPVPREYELRKPPYYVDLSTYLEHLVEKTKNLKTKKKSKQKLRIIAQREIMTRLFKTEKMNMEISTIDAPIIEIPRRGTASMDTSAAQSSKMDIAP